MTLGTSAPLQLVERHNVPIVHEVARHRQGLAGF